MWTTQRNSAVPLGIKWVANLQKCLKTEFFFKYERKFWRTAQKRNNLQERRTDFSWHFGRKFLHQIIQDLNLIFWPIPPVAQTNKTSKWLFATGTDERTQLFTEIYTWVNIIKVFKVWNNSAMATKTILLPMIIKHSHNTPSSVECTELWIY